MKILKQELAKYQQQVEAYLAASHSIGIVLLDTDLNIQDCNTGFLQLFNLQQPPFGETLASYLQLDTNDIRCGEHLKLPHGQKSGIDAINSCFLIPLDNGYLLFCERHSLRESRVLEQIGTMNNELINLQRDAAKKNHQLEKLKNELAERVAELEAAAARVKKLEGIIPICMYCKKIRDSREIWNNIEEYISEHSDALFSHGICPHCLDQQMEKTKERLRNMRQKSE